ncbi:MAG: hypothetical protein AB7U82_02665 [Blastocatellales bacterium]
MIAISSAATFFERRPLRLALKLFEDRLDDRERDELTFLREREVTLLFLPFLPFASTGAENGQATQMVRKATASSLGSVG